MKSERRELGSRPGGVRIEFELKELGSRIRGDPQGIIESVVEGIDTGDQAEV